MDHDTVETCIVVRRVSISGLFWKKWTLWRPKTKRTIQAVISKKVRVCLVWGCVSALVNSNLHFCDDTSNAEKYIEILEQHLLPSRRHLFHRHPCIVQQDNAKPHCAHISQAWLLKKRVGVLDWPACSPDLAITENMCHTLRLVCRKNETKSLLGLHHLVSWVPKRLFKCCESKWFTVPTSFEICCKNQNWNQFWKKITIHEVKHQIMCFCFYCNTGQRSFIITVLF